MNTVYLALGSNVGDREKFLNSALKSLDTPDLQRRKVSAFYETEPVGLREQAWFLNIAAQFETTLFPLQLLHRAQRIERDLGRKRLIPNGPRTVDIDILFYGEAIINSLELNIPHPRFRERRFVLAPLAEIAPGLRDPVTGRTVLQLLGEIKGQVVRPA